MKKVFFFIAASLLLPAKGVSNTTDSSTRSDTVSLNEVEVVSVRAGAKTPVAHSELDQKTIESNNFGRDIPFLLTLTPSVIATSDAGTGIGYTGFRIRGTDANRINITTNGIPLNDSESHGVFWVNMPDFASSLQDLQIQRGVGTSTNGAGAFGASINMKTEHVPQVAYSEFNGSFGSFNTQKATFKAGTGVVGEHFAFDARLSSLTSDGFIDRAAVDLKSYFVQGVYFNNNTLVKFIIFSGKEQTYHAWDGVPADILEAGDRTYNPSGYMGDDADGKPIYYANQTDNYRQTHYQLSVAHRLNNFWKLNAALHYTKGVGYYEEYKTGRKLVEYGLNNFTLNGETVKKSDLVRQKHLDNDFYGGIFSFDYKNEKLTASLGGGANRYDGNHFGKIIWIKNYADDASFAPDREYYRSTGDKTDANIYLKADYEIVDNLNLYGDLQYRFIDYKIKGKNDTYDYRIGEMQNLAVSEKFNFFNPKAGVFYTINNNNSAFGSVAVAHREPNRNNYTDAGENEIPRQERLLDYEIGYKFADSRFSAGVNLYYMYYKDQLVLTGKVNEIGEPLTSNVPESYRTGAEFQAGAKIAAFLDWNGNLTVSKNRIKRFTEYVDVFDENWEAVGQAANDLKDRTIAFSPSVVANSLFSFHCGQFSAMFHSSYVGKQYLDNTGNDACSIDPSFVNNLTVGYVFKTKFVKEIAFNIQINNIFDAQYESSGWVYSYYSDSAEGRTRYAERAYFPQAGTNVLANVRMKF